MISLNPKAGRTDPARRAAALRRAVERCGLRAELLTNLDEVTERANALFGLRRLRALVGVGGDGTAAELVNRSPVGTPVTVLPAGTANLIAREFRLPSHPNKAAEMLRIGACVTVDAGRIRFPDVNSPAEDATDRDSTAVKSSADGRLFLVLASVGIDAEIVRRVHRNREANYQAGKRRGAHIGYLSYIKPIFQAIWTYRYPKMAITVEGGAPLGKKDRSESARSVSARWAFVFNLARYGFGAAPVVGCRPDDRRLDHCFFGHGGFWPSILGVLCAQCAGGHRFLPRVALGSGRMFRFSPVVSTDAIPFEIDGDPAGYLPVAIEAVPNRVTLVVPDAMARRFDSKRSPSEADAVPAEAPCGAELRVKSE